MYFKSERMVVKDVDSQVIWTHCVLPRESLIVNETIAEFSDTFGLCNEIHWIPPFYSFKYALQTHLLSSLCTAAGKNTLSCHHSKVQWLSLALEEIVILIWLRCVILQIREPIFHMFCFVLFFFICANILNQFMYTQKQLVLVCLRCLLRG